MRASGVPLAAGIWETSTEAIAALMLGPPPTECSPYSGWKQPANRPAATKGAASRTHRDIPRRISNHHIDDSVRDNDDLFGRFAVERLFHGIEPQHRRLNITVRGI